jgi:hypothetical protein
MKSFTSSYNRKGHDPHYQQTNVNSEATNNYETVEYCGGAESGRQQTHGETANTEDVYYQENNEIYVGDVKDRSYSKRISCVGFVVLLFIRQFCEV